MRSLKIPIVGLGLVALTSIVIATASQYGQGSGPRPMFEDVTPPALREPGSDSTGACWADVDADGDEDLFVANGNHTSHLWRNTGRGEFVDAGEAAGIIFEKSRQFVSCAFVDVDNDGDLDLYLTGRRNRKNTGPANRLFENLGNGTYRDRTAKAGVGRAKIGGNASDWADFDNDGDLDAYVASRDPDDFNAFFEQLRPFVFRDIGPEKGLADVDGPDTAFLGSWFDYDADGDMDLLVALDYWGVEVYRQDFGRFVRATRVALPPATDDTPGAPPNNAMGIAWGDYDNDGCFDVFITGLNVPGVTGFDTRVMSDLFSRLYRNDCHGTFTDVTRQAGFRPTGLTEWAANFIDFDNDGDLDLSVVAGNAGERPPEGEKKLSGAGRQLVTLLVTGLRRVIPSRFVAWAYRYELMIPASGSSGPAAAMPKLLYKNLLVESGIPRFIDVTEGVGIRDIGATRGSAWADMDGDGDLDWFMPNRRTPKRLFQNNGPVGAFLRVHLRGTRIRTAVGAWVKIRVGTGIQVRHVHILDGYLAQSQMDPHFGLGKADQVDEIWVRWPGTARWILMCKAVPANSKVLITEGMGCSW